MSRGTVLAVVLLAACGAGAQEFVPFVIPPRPDGGSLIATSSGPFDVAGPRIVVRNGRFVRDGKRVRVWGVNTCFGANFPSHADAPHVARRLAEAGVNSVRLHHMDSARWPRGIWTRDGRALEPQALDRLDFFVNELAKRGICINLNLHVGRAHSRFLGLEQPNTKYDKIAGIFTPKLVDAQKRYARKLLTRMNKYRKVRYADDPAVAFVEITNEDSLFMWSAARDLRNLPPSYAAILVGLYNDWLKARYATTDRLRAAWAKGAQPLGKNMLVNPALAPAGEGKAPAGWALEQHAGCVVDTRRVKHAGRDALLVDIRKSDGTSWHLQARQGEVKLKAGKYYTVTATVAAARPRRVGCGVGMNHEPWGSLGLSRSLSVGAKWQTFRMGFVAKDDDDNARVSFSIGGSDVDVYFAEVRMQPGGIEGLTKGERLENGTVRLFAECESEPRTIDRMLFFAETEKAYFDGMYRFIKRDLGCKALVTGTVVFGPLGLWGQSGMDFIDGHAYWQHPHFPGRPWDGNNWLVGQKAMVDNPASATLPRLAAQRLAGKPYTVSEYNHPAPNDYQAECVPMLASFAAAQDWDGIWLFTYASGGGNWADERLRGFFDMQMNPAKWGFVRAGAAMFRDYGLAPLAAGACWSLGPLRDAARRHRTFDRDMAKLLYSFGNKLDWGYMTRRQVAWHFGSIRIGTLRPVEGKSPLTWAQSNRTGGQYVAAGRGARAFVGQAGRMAKVTKGELTLKAPRFAAVTMTALDGKPLTESRNVLIAACGRCENVGMVFAKDRRTVGRNWGRAPVQIEAVTGLLRLPPGTWRCQALAPNGRPRATVQLQEQAGKPILPLSPKHKTMWYLLTR